MTPSATPRGSMRLITLVVTLLILAGTLYWFRSQQPAASPTVAARYGEAFIVPGDIFAGLDFLGGPELSLVPSPAVTGKEVFAEAQAAESNSRAKFAEAAALQTARNLEVPAGDGATSQAETTRLYREYRQRELEAYRRLTLDQGDAKAAGEAFFEKYLRAATFNDGDEAGVVRVGEAALAAGSTDPMLKMYLAFMRWSVNLDDKSADVATNCDALDQVLRETIPQLCGGKYPAIVPMHARTWADMCFYRQYNSQFSPRWNNAVIAIVRWLEADSVDKNLRRALYGRLTVVWDAASRQQQEALLSAMLESKTIDPWLVHTSAGRYYVALAWDNRGEGSRGPVVSESSRGFGENLIRGATHLRYAWSLAPELPEAPALMIPVAMAGYDVAESKWKRVFDSISKEPRSYDWFLRAVEADLAYGPAYNSLWTSLLPRWGGSVTSMATFARNCAATRRFDVFVPYYGIDMLMHSENAEELATDPEFNAALFVRDFLDHRAAYREAHPKEVLWGENPYYRTSVAILLDRLEFFPEALAEVDAAGEKVDYARLQLNGRNGGFLWDKLAAAQAPNRELVLDFDDQIHAPWIAGAGLQRIDDLQSQCDEIEKAVAPTHPRAQRYFHHARTILSQLRTFESGEWVALDFDSDLSGWESYGAPVLDHEDSSTIVLKRRSPKNGPATLRLLAPFHPPFEIQCDLSLPEAPPELPVTGIHFGEEMWLDKLGYQEPHITLDTRTVWQKDWRAKVGWASSKRSDPTEPVRDAGAIPVSMQVWPELTAGRVGSVLFLDRPGRPQQLSDVLVIGESGLKDSKSAEDGKGSLRVARMRIRRLTSPQPPARLAPPAERNAYWTARLEEQPANSQFTTWLSDAQLADGRFEVALKLADESSASFALARRVKALALYRLKRYSEAMPLLMAANKECDGNDYLVNSAIGAIICAAADPALRKVDDETVTSVQAGHLYGREGLYTGGKDQPEPLATIALAAAAEGKFDEARQQNLEAIRLAGLKNDAVLEKELRERQAIYESNQAVTLP